MRLRQRALPPTVTIINEDTAGFEDKGKGECTGARAAIAVESQGGGAVMEKDVDGGKKEQKRIKRQRYIYFFS